MKKADVQTVLQTAYDVVSNVLPDADGLSYDAQLARAMMRTQLVILATQLLAPDRGPFDGQKFYCNDHLPAPLCADCGKAIEAARMPPIRWQPADNDTFNRR